MAVPKRKTSRMQRRQRKAANRYKGVQATYCPNCNAPVAPHRVCTAYRRSRSRSHLPQLSASTHRDNELRRRGAEI